MLNKLRSNPFAASLVVLAIYFSWFSVPVLFVELDPNRHGLSGVAEAVKQWKNQLALSTFFIIVLSLLGWWKKTGFSALNNGGLKYLLPPVCYILFMLTVALSDSDQFSWLLGSSSPGQMISLALVCLGIGFTEEIMFRGILFYGFSTRFTVLTSVVSTALIFGVFHFENIIMGASFADTFYQVLHAAAAGFMYIALRLRIGAIWPVILFHGLWDFCLFNMDNFKASADNVTPMSPLVISAFQILPAALYGIFVYWRWSVYQKKHGRDRELQAG